MLLVILGLATVVILAGVVFAALGRAGEMATFPGDGPPFEFDEVTANDVAFYRPPMAFWGYYVPAVEEALQLIARSVTAKDAEIAALRREVSQLRGYSPDVVAPAAEPPAAAWPQSWGKQAEPWMSSLGPPAAPAEPPGEPGDAGELDMGEQDTGEQDTGEQHRGERRTGEYDAGTDNIWTGTAGTGSLDAEPLADRPASPGSGSDD